MVVFKARTVTVSKNALKSEEENTIPNTWATGGARREECERRGIEQGRAICKVFICMHCTVEQSAKCGSVEAISKCGSVEAICKCIHSQFHEQQFHLQSMKCSFSALGHFSDTS